MSDTGAGELITQVMSSWKLLLSGLLHRRRLWSYTSIVVNPCLKQQPRLTLLTRGSVASQVLTLVGDLAGEAGSQPEPCTERCDVRYFLSSAASRSPKVLWSRTSLCSCSSSSSPCPSRFIDRARTFLLSYPSKFHRCSSWRRCRTRVVQRQCRGSRQCENCGVAAVAVHRQGCVWGVDVPVIMQ